MQNENNTIFDDVIRTIQERHPKLLLPLFNEVFHTSYGDSEPIYRLPEEYRKVVSKVLAIAAIWFKIAFITWNFKAPRMETW